jgi:hypothetical protein
MSVGTSEGLIGCDQPWGSLLRLGGTPTRFQPSSQRSSNPGEGIPVVPNRPTVPAGDRWEGQQLNFFPCHIEVAKGWRTVANLRKLRREVRGLRTIRVLHGSLVRRKLHNGEVSAIVVSIAALHRPARRSSTLRFGKPFIEGAVECVNIASLELNELYELHAYTSNVEFIPRGRSITSEARWCLLESVQGRSNGHGCDPRLGPRPAIGPVGIAETEESHKAVHRSLPRWRAVSALASACRNSSWMSLSSRSARVTRSRRARRPAASRAAAAMTS